MKLCGYPMSCWPASWMRLRKHPRESARVSTRGSGMAKEGFLCFRREQCLALACLVCLEPQWYTRACCGEGGREHLWCAVQHVAAQHEQQQWQQQQKRVGAVLCTPHMHTQWWTHGRAQNVHTVVCTPVCVCVSTHNACAGWCAHHSHGWGIFEKHCR